MPDSDHERSAMSVRKTTVKDSIERVESRPVGQEILPFINHQSVKRATLGTEQTEWAHDDTDRRQPNLLLAGAEQVSKTLRPCSARRVVSLSANSVFPVPAARHNHPLIPSQRLHQPALASV